MYFTVFTFSKYRRVVFACRPPLQLAMMNKNGCITALSDTIVACEAFMDGLFLKGMHGALLKLVTLSTSLGQQLVDEAVAGVGSAVRL